MKTSNVSNIDIKVILGHGTNTGIEMPRNGTIEGPRINEVEEMSLEMNTVFYAKLMKRNLGPQSAYHHDDNQSTD